MRVVPCTIFSRIVGYYAPINNWNKGKREEFNHRVTYDPNKNQPHDRGVWDMRTKLVEEGVLHG